MSINIEKLGTFCKFSKAVASAESLFLKNYQETS
jgi:hypothetical protein